MAQQTATQLRAEEEEMATSKVNMGMCVFLMFTLPQLSCVYVTFFLAQLVLLFYDFR